MAEESLTEEHARLLRQTEELRRDHADLEARRHDVSTHREHGLRLQKPIDALHDPIDRIKREGSEPPSE